MTNPELLPGARIGEYTIDAVLGRGPMGVTYLARNAGGAQVGVKVLIAAVPLSDSAKQDIAEDFYRIEDLAMPQVPAILEFLRFDDRYVVVTEYSSWGSLAVRLAHGPMIQTAAVTLIRHLAYAVGQIHQAGVVHGAIKPTNVLRYDVDSRAVPTITDLGGALRAQHWVVPAGAELGSEYRAPEVSQGNLTPQCDVYALGVLFATLLGVKGSPEIERIIARATAHRPGDRYANGTELFQALGSITMPTVQEVASTPSGGAAAPVIAAVPEIPGMSVTPPLGATPVEAVIPEQPLSKVESKTTSPGRRILTPAEVDSAKGGYRSRTPLIIGIIAIVVIILILSVLLSGERGSALRSAPSLMAPIVASSSAYRAVSFSLSRPKGDSAVVEVLNAGSWTQVGAPTYRLPTSRGSQKVCASFRVADSSADPTAYSAVTTACGTSSPPTLSVKRDTSRPCEYDGTAQICYELVSGGLEPGKGYTLELQLNGQSLNKFDITIDKSGHASLPVGERIHFSREDQGGAARISIGDLRYSWRVDSL